MILVLLLAAILTSSVARAQEAQGGEPDAFTFTSDAALIMWQILPDKAEDFELVWRVIRQRVDANGGADLHALMQNLRIYQPGLATGDALTYVFHIDPVVPGRSYSPTFLLFESKLFERAEADELFARMSGALAPGNAISTMPLKKTP
jgi:hypothetical protein